MGYGAWLTVVLAGLAVAGCSGPGPEQRETATAPVDAVLHRVEVDSDAGPVRLVAGDRGSVRQELRWTGDARPEVAHRVAGGVLTVTARCPDGGQQRCQAGLEITVPAAAEARVRLAAGSIEVSGLTGRQDLATRSGGVRGSGLGPGPVTARADAGGVELALAAPAPEVDAESGAGSVEVRLPEGPGYDVTARTGAGSAEVTVPDRPGAPHRVTARSSAGGVTVSPAR